MQKKRMQQLQNFCKIIGIEMDNLSLLDMALTHTSYSNEVKGRVKPQHNESIEFLGDSVLSVIVSTYMYKNFPKLDEGKLTKLRAYLVCETSLYKFAKKICLGDYLLLGNGEEQSGGRDRPSLLADAFESVLGAYYLDQGLERAQIYLLGVMQEEIDYICAQGVYSDFKTNLQEYLQRDGDVDISYRIVNSSGPEHNKIFTAEVMLHGKSIGKGSGRSKKDAEQHAAQDALQSMHMSLH